MSEGLLHGGGKFLWVQEYRNVLRWTDLIAERPAVKRGRIVSCAWGDLAGQLQERHEASDFETRTQARLSAATK